MSAKTRLRLPRESAIDRRVARTRTALYDALVRLIRRKPYDDITLADILAEADVGRSTFYQHFSSRDELLARSLERLEPVLLDAGAADLPDGPAGVPWGFSAALFEHIAEYREVHSALVGTSGERIVAETIGAILGRFLRDRMASEARPAGPVPRELLRRHIVATFMTVMSWWLEKAPGVSPAEADVLFRRLVLAGIEREETAGHP
jgi:AcrR family transcriptional regulator